MIVFWALDFLRKTLLCLVVTYGKNLLWLQSLCFFLTSITIMTATHYTQARNTAFDQRMDVFNEAKILILMYHMIIFTEFVDDPELKFQIGYVCSASLLAGVLVNMFMLFSMPFELCKSRLRLKQFQG